MKAENLFKYGLLFIFQISVVMALQAQNTVFYGTASSGGTNGNGVIFKTDNNGENYTVVHNFDGENGSYPSFGKLCYVNGILYGTTVIGGINEMGVLFSYNIATQAYIKLHDFDGVNSGNGPRDNVIQAFNGKLYGTTSSGGISDGGTLFDFDIESGILTKKLDFIGHMGNKILGNVLQGSNGKLYGYTENGGLNENGVLFEYDYTTEVFKKLFDFKNKVTGSNPSVLIEVENNILYGTCYYGGGVNGGGNLFEYNILTNIFSIKFDFNRNVDGFNPRHSLMKASNGKLYGLMYVFRVGGGTGSMLYEYDISTETFEKKLDFDGEFGKAYNSKLLEANNGYLYGLSYASGLDNQGTIIQYHIETNKLTNKFNFITATGSNPLSSLIEIDESSLGNTDFIHNSAEVVFWPNPVNDIMNLKTNEAVPFRANIYNLLGQEIRSDENFKTNHLLNVSHLKTGIYILTVIYQNGNSKSIKFIKN